MRTNILLLVMFGSVVGMMYIRIKLRMEYCVSASAQGVKIANVKQNIEEEYQIGKKRQQILCMFKMRIEKRQNKEKPNERMEKEKEISSRNDAGTCRALLSDYIFFSIFFLSVFFSLFIIIS